MCECACLCVWVCVCVYVCVCVCSVCVCVCVCVRIHAQLYTLICGLSCSHIVMWIVKSFCICSEKCKGLINWNVAWCFFSTNRRKLTWHVEDLPAKVAVTILLTIMLSRYIPIYTQFSRGAKTVEFPNWRWFCLPCRSGKEVGNKEAFVGGTSYLTTH